MVSWDVIALWVALSALIIVIWRQIWQTEKRIFREIDRKTGSKKVLVRLDQPYRARSWMFGDYTVRYKEMNVEDVVPLILDHLELAVEETPARAKKQKLVKCPIERVFEYKSGEEEITDGDA